MKRTILLLQIAAISCSSPVCEDNGLGELRFSFTSFVEEEVRSVNDVPDTSDFILSIKKSDGYSIYNGRYADCPESIEVEAGSYVVSARSSDFSKPAFSKPQFGDEQCVVVRKDETVNVLLMCRQLNSGVRLIVSPAFLTEYPSGVLFLKASDGKLMYSYSEKRFAYFKPGPVSLLLSRDGNDEILMTRELEAQEMALIRVDVASSGEMSSKNGIVMEIDTSRVWTHDQCVIGDGVKGNTPETAVSVAQARTMASRSDVWVSGYVVGGDLTQSSGSFDEPFKSKSNIILGPRSTTVDRQNCIAVQLPSGCIRDELNLVDNPSLLGSRICIHGDLVEDYFSLVGLKNPDDCIIY